MNEDTVTDFLYVSEEMCSLNSNDDEILVSYVVVQLFTQKETIKILVDKAFVDDWFNTTYGMKFERHQLAELLEIATMNQLFQFNEQLYMQVDGVAMGSPLSPLMQTCFCAT